MDIAAIRARLEATTPGGWTRHGADIRADYAPGVIFTGRDGSAQIRAQADRDAEFVAHAREDIAALLALVQKHLHQCRPEPESSLPESPIAISPPPWWG